MRARSRQTSTNSQALDANRAVRLPSVTAEVRPSSAARLRNARVSVASASSDRSSNWIVMVVDTTGDLARRTRRCGARSAFRIARADLSLVCEVHRWLSGARRPATDSWSPQRNSCSATCQKNLVAATFFPWRVLRPTPFGGRDQWRDVASVPASTGARRVASALTRNDQTYRETHVIVTWIRQTASALTQPHRRCIRAIRHQLHLHRARCLTDVEEPPPWLGRYLSAVGPGNLVEHDHLLVTVQAVENMREGETNRRHTHILYCSFATPAPASFHRTALAPETEHPGAEPLPRDDDGERHGVPRRRRVRCSRARQWRTSPAPAEAAPRPGWRASRRP